MASKTEDLGHRYNNKDFPILYGDDEIRIFKNPGKEIFVEDVVSGAIIRLGPCHQSGGGLQFTTDGRVEPILVGNTIGWRVCRY